eukprot:3578056-Rhodomonas_salina.2
MPIELERASVSLQLEPNYRHTPPQYQTRHSSTRQGMAVPDSDTVYSRHSESGHSVRYVSTGRRIAGA